MRYIPITSVSVDPSRQRQFFDPDSLAELQQSIASVGLIHPLTVTADGTLVCGERRLKCLLNLHFLGQPIRFDGELVPADCVPVCLPGESGDTNHYEIELEENIRRKDLTWQEQAEATRRLRDLRALQAQEANLPEPTAADIAQEVEGRRDGAYQAKTRKALLVAGHLSNPAVAKAKTLDDAFKILKREATARENRDLSIDVKARHLGDRLAAHKGDSLEWGWSYVEGKHPLFDIICTDPPYGMDAQNFGDGGGAYVGIDHSYADDRASWLDLMNRFAQLSFAITKTDAHLYLCCDIDGFLDLKDMFGKAGWRVHRTPLINVKRDANRVPWPSQGPRRHYELVLYAVKGSKPTTAIYSDVFETTGDENLGHGAQKPVAMWEDLLKRSARPGDRVWDAFAGTGGILVAAQHLDLCCTVCERDEAHFGTILKRLGELV